MHQDIEYVLNRLNSLDVLSGEDFLSTVTKLETFSEKEARFYLLNVIEDYQSTCSWCVRSQNRINPCFSNRHSILGENQVLFITDSPNPLDNSLGNLMSDLIDLIVLAPNCQKDFSFLSKHSFGETNISLPSQNKIEDINIEKIKIIPEFQLNEDSLGNFYTNGQVFSSLLNLLSVDRKDIYITSVIGCPSYSENGSDYSPKAKDSYNCKNWLDLKIKLIRPRSIVAMGSLASKQFSERPLQEIAGNSIVSYKYNTHVICTYSPGTVIKYRNSKLKLEFYNKIAEHIKIGLSNDKVK